MSEESVKLLTGEYEEYKPVIKATKEEMEAAKIHPKYRDVCAHILIPLNECRRETLFAPWKCTDLRHSYEKCQYDDFIMRCKEKKRQEFLALNKNPN